MLVRSSIIPPCCKSRGCAANKSWGIWEYNSFGRPKSSHYCFGLRPRGKQGFNSFLLTETCFKTWIKTLLVLQRYNGPAKVLIYSYWHLVDRCRHDVCCKHIEKNVTNNLILLEKNWLRLSRSLVFLFWFFLLFCPFLFICIFSNENTHTVCGFWRCTTLAQARKLLNVLIFMVGPERFLSLMFWTLQRD